MLFLTEWCHGGPRLNAVEEDVVSIVLRVSSVICYLYGVGSLEIN